MPHGSSLALGITLGVAFAAFGGVHHETRGALHLLLALTLFLGAALPARTLARGGALRDVLKASGWLLGAVGIGLVLLPVPLLAFVAPGTAAIASGRWSTLSVSPEGTLGELTHLLLVVGAAVACGAWALARGRRHRIEGALVGAGGLLVVVAGAHAGTGTSSLFGIVDTWVTPPDRFFAPFLNANHLASSLLLPLPLVAGTTLQDTRDPGSRIAWLSLTGLLLAMIVWTGSAGGIVAAALALVGVGVLVGGLPRWVPVPVGLAGLGVLVLTDPLSEHGRLAIWRAAGGLFLRHPWTGSGGGTFRGAIEPYRIDRDYVSWDHAHNDLLEWGVETGLVGLVALGLAARALFHRPTRSPDRAALILLGVGAVGVHALVEFPLQIPAIAMAAGALVVGVRILYSPRTRGDVRSLRGAMIVLAVAEILAGGWEIRSAVVATAAEAVLARDVGADEAADRMAQLAWWRPEADLHRAWALQDAGDGAGAAVVALQVADAHRGDPAALRRAASILVREGHPEALPVALAAVDRAPADWRTWATRAIVIESVAPEEAGQAWIDAIAHAAPPRLVSRGWRYVPVGLPWVQAVSDLPARYSATMAVVLQKLDDDESALLAFEQARLGNPEVVHPGHPRLLLALGRVDAAEALLREALAARPDDVRFLGPMAEALVHQGRHAEAADAWLQLSRRDARVQSKAIEATATASGAPAALALVDRLELEQGRSGVTLGSRLVEGRLWLEQGEGARCVEVLVRSGALEDSATRREADTLMQACRAPR